MSKKEKFYYLYKTTNLINGKYYYGMHCTSNLEDGYLGSGKILNLSIKKYGKENFKKDILSFYKDRQELIQAEKDLITLEVVNESQCLNLIPGGTGGFSVEQQKKNNLKSQIKQAWLKNNDVEWQTKRIEFHSNQFKELHKQGVLKHYDWTGRKHSDETKKKIGLKNSINQNGEKNSQAGTCWIHNNIENKKVKKHEIEVYLLEGWSKGRKMKF